MKRNTLDLTVAGTQHIAFMKTLIAFLTVLVMALSGMAAHGASAVHGDGGGHHHAGASDGGEGCSHDERAAPVHADASHDHAACAQVHCGVECGAFIYASGARLAAFPRIAPSADDRLRAGNIAGFDPPPPRA